MKTLLALALFAIPSFANAADLYDFSGTYKLVKGVYGICDEQTRVFTSGDPDDGATLSIGGYFFPYINQPTRRSENEITRDTNTTVFKNNQVTYRQVSYNKLSNETTHTLRSVALKGNRLTFSSKFWGPLHVHGETLCVFVKVADPETNF
jgi:hypothetical protein